MASLDDILSTVKNIPVGLNALAQTWRRGQGNLTSAPISAVTTLATGSGRLVSVSIIDDGSGAGAIYNAASDGAAGSTNTLAVVPTGGTDTVLTLGLEFNAGLVVSPGTGQTLVVTYFQG